MFPFSKSIPITKTFPIWKGSTLKRFPVWGEGSHILERKIPLLGGRMSPFWEVNIPILKRFAFSEGRFPFWEERFSHFEKERFPFWEGSHFGKKDPTFWRGRFPFWEEGYPHSEKENSHFENGDIAETQRSPFWKQESYFQREDSHFEKKNSPFIKPTAYETPGKPFFPP